jgi:hypothetical protein
MTPFDPCHGAFFMPATATFVALDSSSATSIEHATTKTHSVIRVLFLVTA